MWEGVQKKLAEASSRVRGQANVAHPSPLAGKLFDETGDRLTPSHANKNGKRLRYYISRRLVIDKSIKHPDAWRLPAPQLERAIARAVNEHFSKSDTLPSLVEKLQTNEVASLNRKLGSLGQMFASQNPVQKWRGQIAKINITPGMLTIELDASAIAKHLDLPIERFSLDALTIDTSFQLRRRGVETKIILGCAPPEIDLILIRNIVKAMAWYGAVKSGKSFAQIAEKAGITTNRVRHLVDLAFLAPDIIEQAISGTLPLHMTSDYRIRTGVPSDWNAQRKMLENVGAKAVR